MARFEQQITELKRLLGEICRAQLLPHGTYLAGGIALFLTLHHRLSVDLDFFSPGKFSSGSILGMMKEQLRKCVVELQEENTLIVSADELKTRISLFYYPYKLIEAPKIIILESKLECSIGSLRDLRAMKAATIAQRGYARDFFDFYVINRILETSFDQVAAEVIEKFGLTREYEYQLRTAFVYFDDAEAQVGGLLICREDGSISTLQASEWEEIKAYFRRLVL
jgi:hypothetical protein